MTAPTDAGMVERLVAATVGSRKLDAEINVSDYDPTADIKPPHTDVASCLGCGCAPHYTSSIDAALTLVPEGCAAWDVGFAYNGGPYQARVYLVDPEKNLAIEIEQPHKHSAAIALCIACLKAHQSLRTRSPA